MPKRRTSVALLKYNDDFLTFPKGSVLFSEGDKGEEMFVVKVGTVELRVP